MNQSRTRVDNYQTTIIVKMDAAGSIEAVGDKLDRPALSRVHGIGGFELVRTVGGSD